MSRVDEIRERIETTQSLEPSRQRTALLQQLHYMLRTAVREEQLGE